ncbi:MAG: SH3 domain-containing protein [Clostridia bacterium]|nr:SH3 domain-containing protein [Clostridia bacterium]
MKRKWKVLVCLMMVCFLLPVSASAGLYWGEIVRITSKSAVNVYSGPGRDYKFIGEAMSTNTYDFLGQEGDWNYIQFTSTKRGYVPVKYTTIEGGLVWRNGPGEVDAVVRNTHYNSLNVRNAPDKESRVLGEMKPDTTLEYCGTENGWNRVLYKGDYAYVAGNRTAIEVVNEKYGSDAISGATGSAHCDVCGGTAVCQTCDGQGYIYSVVNRDDVDCPSCAGLGLCYACYDNSGY